MSITGGVVQNCGDQVMSMLAVVVQNRGDQVMHMVGVVVQDLGVTKVGHLKRIQQAIKELHHREAAYDRPST